MKNLLIFLIIACLSASCPADATQYNLGSKGTAIPSDWFRTGRLADYGTNWARAIDDLVELGSNPGTGSVFYVDSGVSNEGDGTGWLNAKDTLDEAVALCTANNGDVILVAQGHAETLSAADAVDLDVAGITVKGLGNGEDMPEFTFGHANAEFVIGAANITVVNCRFLAGITAVAMGISIEAAGNNFTLGNCIFPKPTTNSWEFNDAIDVADGADNILIYGCEYYNDEAGAAPNHFIDAGNGTAGPEKLQVVNCIIKGDFAVAAIWSDEPCDEAYIVGNTIVQHTAGQHCIELTDAGTGVIAYNTLYSSAKTTTLDPGSMSCYENYVTINTDESAVLIPAAATIAGQMYTSTMTATSQNDDLFDVDGGAILITSFTGIVTTEIGAVTNIIAIDLDADSGWIDSDFSTAVETNADVAGTRYVFSDASESVLTPISDTTGNTNSMRQWYCGEGMIEQSAGGATTGAIKWYMTWIPFDDGTTVTAQ